MNNKKGFQIFITILLIYDETIGWVIPHLGLTATVLGCLVMILSAIVYIVITINVWRNPQEKRDKTMQVEIYYRKYQKGKLNYEIDQLAASKLTLDELVNDYVCVAQIQQPDGTLPDKIYSMYQERPLHLPGGIDHTSMSIGDIVWMDGTIHVCCRTGWYTVELKRVQSGNILAG